MADYYPLIEKAISGLEKSTGEARRGLYERARKALVAQLRGVNPPLSEPDITRERLALEEAIRKVEAEAARRSRNDPPPPARPEPRKEQPAPPPARLSPPTPPPPEPEDQEAEELPPAPAPPRMPRSPRSGPIIRPAAPLSAAAVTAAPELHEPEEKPAETPAVTEPPRLERTRWTPGGGPSLSDKGLKGFRDVVAETETLGGATAQAAKTMRAGLQGTSARIEPRAEPRAARRAEPRVNMLRGDFRNEPRGEPRGDLRLDTRPEMRGEVREEPKAEPEPSRPLSRRPSPRDAARVVAREAAEPDREVREPKRARGVERPSRRRVEPPPPPIDEPDDLPIDAPEPGSRDFDTSFRAEPPTRAPSSIVRQEDVRARMPARPKPAREERAKPAAAKRPGRWRRTAAIAIMALLGLAIAGIAAWKAPGIIASFRSPAGRDRTAELLARPDAGKSKITDRAIPGPYTTQGGLETAPVAQKVVLYEEDASDPNGKRYVGSAVWRVDRNPPSPGQKPEVAIRADIDIPEQKMAVRWSLRRNDDNGAASHTIEIMFTPPADFPHGGIANIPGILMKQSESGRGTPLAGLVVKVTNNFFLIGLSSTDSDMQRNIQLLKERTWFDVPVVYGDGKRAIIAIEKGTPGERVFTDAFASWNQ